MQETTVVAFTRDEIVKLKQIVMDGDGAEGLLFLKAVIKKIAESENKGLKGAL